MVVVLRITYRYHSILKTCLVIQQNCDTRTHTNAATISTKGTALSLTGAYAITRVRAVVLAFLKKTPDHCFALYFACWLDQGDHGILEDGWVDIRKLR